MEDTRKELERLERELLAEEEIGEIPELALDDLEEPVAYSNDSNDYSEELQEFAETGGEEATGKEKKNDKAIIGLMITASVLCLGIIGVLIYWLEVFLA